MGFDEFRFFWVLGSWFSRFGFLVSRFRVRGVVFGVRVFVLGFSGSRVRGFRGFAIRVRGFGVSLSRLGLLVRGSGFSRFRGSGFCLHGSGFSRYPVFAVRDFGFRVSRFGVWVLFSGFFGFGASGFSRFGVSQFRFFVSEFRGFGGFAFGVRGLAFGVRGFRVS